jgi:hypothetical protein
VEITVPCTMTAISVAVAMYGGSVHGDTPSGECDVEFPTVAPAASFSTTYRGLGWTMDIRKGDAVSSLDSPVVLTIYGTRRD